MAVLPHSLCIALTLLVTSSCLMAERQPESPNSSKRWGAEEFNDVPHLAANLRKSGDYPRLARLYREALEQARALDLPERQLAFLIALGNTYLLQFEYSQAFTYFVEARRLAEGAKDWESLAIIANNLSSAYLAVGDFDAALEVTRESLASYGKWKSAGQDPEDEFVAPLELQYVRLRMVMDPAGDWEPLIYNAIQRAQLQLDKSPLAQPGSPDVRLEAQAWDILGELRLQRSELDGAERAFNEAHRLRMLHAPERLSSSYLRLAELRLAQAQSNPARRSSLLEEAQRFNEKYRDSVRESHSTLSHHMVLHQRGRIRLLQGNASEAIADFSQAADLAERWRAGVIPAYPHRVLSPSIARFMTGFMTITSRR